MIRSETYSPVSVSLSDKTARLPNARPGRDEWLGRWQEENSSLKDPFYVKFWIRQQLQLAARLRNEGYRAWPEAIYICGFSCQKIHVARARASGLHRQVFTLHGAVVCSCVWQDLSMFLKESRPLHLHRWRQISENGCCAHYITVSMQKASPYL
jgi:hypothetical protein